MQNVKVEVNGQTDGHGKKKIMQIPSWYYYYFKNIVYKAYIFLISQNHI